ncbi:MAG: lipoyl synthase [Thermoplasmata archaeon]
MSAGASTDATGVPRPTDGPRLPAWIRTRPPEGARYVSLKATLETLRLGTVCREARCPNLPECWSAGTATVMLLGTACTRRCGFCAVETRWPRGRVDADEPERVAAAVAASGLRYVVLTQVCRDDLPDGGAAHLARTIEAIRARDPAIRVELLIGDLAGSEDSLRTVLGARPDVLAHNVETVRRLTARVRDRRARYEGSLSVLARAKEIGGPGCVTKSSIMLGLGETDEEVEAVLGDLRRAGVDLLTLGQYLRPSPGHLPVVRFVPPDEFARWAERARAIGFAGVAAGPLVRSSYRADELYSAARLLSAGTGGV